MKSRSKLERLLIGTSAIAMAVSSAIAAAQENAQAQESGDKPTSAQAAATEEQTIVVTGIRAALENAAEIKRKADTFVDSVTASDVAAAVKSAGGPVLDKRAIELPGHIKTTGKHSVTVRLHPEVTVALPLVVNAGE